MNFLVKKAISPSNFSRPPPQLPLFPPPLLPLPAPLPPIPHPLSPYPRPPVHPLIELPLCNSAKFTFTSHWLRSSITPNNRTLSTQSSQATLALIIWACLRWFANNTGADQPAHPRCLISAFVVRLSKSIISRLATSEISIF